MKALPDAAVAVIVGHSNTVPESIKALTGKTVKIEDNEFDKLFVVLIAGDASSVALGRYGRPTP